MAWERDSRREETGSSWRAKHKYTVYVHEDAVANCIILQKYHMLIIKSNISEWEVNGYQKPWDGEVWTLSSEVQRDNAVDTVAYISCGGVGSPES